MTDNAALRRLASGLLVWCTLLLIGTLVSTVVIAARGLEEFNQVDFWTGFIFLFFSASHSKSVRMR